MSGELFQPTLEATSDVEGNIVFTLPPPTGSGLYVQATIAVLDTGSAGDFTVVVSGGVRWGQWSGSQPFGPITYQGNETVKVYGAGLNPLTRYQCQIQAIVDELAELELALPTSTGVTKLFGSKSIVDVSNVFIGSNGATICYRWFPCSSWGSLRLAARCESGGPITIVCTWFNPELTRAMGTRTYILGDGASPGVIGAKLEVLLPHLGDMLEICVQNNTVSG